MIDIAQNKDFDLLIENGDLVLNSDASVQTQRLVVLANKGDNKVFPLVGLNIDDYINSTTPEVEVARRIRQELDSVSISTTTLVVNKIIDVYAKQ